MSTIFHGYWNETHPSSGAVLATWTPAYGATYELDVYAYNLIVADADNLGVYLNSNLLAQLPTPAIVNAVPSKITCYIIAADVADVISVKTIGASSLLSQYHGLAVGRLAIF